MTDVTGSLERYIYYKENRWAFVVDCCKSKDEIDPTNPIKLLPNKEYLRLYCKIWEIAPLLAIPKTRRMTFSWTTIALYVHDFIFKPVRSFAFVSKKEDDANELVLRAKFFLDHIPEDKISRQLIPAYHYTFNNLKCPEMDSKIQGFPQGADQLRQFTFSGVFGDESAFWDNAEEFYSATFPTIDGGGRMTLVSSVAPGFFKRLCFDALDVKGDINVAEYTPDYKVPMQGVRLWMNPKNKFVVLEIHYTSDPTKRDPSYKESIKNSMPLQQYLREYELHWDTYSGHAVFPEFSDIHILNEEPKPSPGLPMLISWDFGLTPAATVAQHEGRTTTFFKEFQAINMGSERFVPMVVAQLRLMFPTHSDFKKNWKCWVDPSGFNRNDNDERQTAMVVAKAGFNPMPGPITWEGRRKAVADALGALDKGKPCFQIYEKGCPITVKGFKGGYHYPEKNVDIAPDKLRPVKNMSSHCFPAGTMVSTCFGAVPIETVNVGDIVETVGGFQHVLATMSREVEETIIIEFKSGATLECTKDHPIWLRDNFLQADCLQYGDTVVVSDLWQKNIESKSLMASDFTKDQRDITSLGINIKKSTCTGLFGLFIMEKFQRSIISITLMEIKKTMLSKISNLFMEAPTLPFMELKEPLRIQNGLRLKWNSFVRLLLYGTNQQKAGNGILNILKTLWQKDQCLIENVSNVDAITKSKVDLLSADSVGQPVKADGAETLEPITKIEHASIVKSLIAQTNTLSSDIVVGKSTTRKSKRVYDLTISATHCFFANGVLVSNCMDTVQYTLSGVKTLVVNHEGGGIPTPSYSKEINGNRIQR